MHTFHLFVFKKNPNDPILNSVFLERISFSVLGVSNSSLDAKTMFEVRTWERFQFFLDCDHQTASI